MHIYTCICIYRERVRKRKREKTMVTDFDIGQQITGGKKVLMKIGESNMVKVT